MHIKLICYGETLEYSFLMFFQLTNVPVHNCYTVKLLCVAWVFGFGVCVIVCVCICACVWVYMYVCVCQSSGGDLDVVEVDLHQVGVVPLHPQQGVLHVGGVGLLVWDGLVLGTLDHTWVHTHTHTHTGILHWNPTLELLSRI